MRCGIRCGSLTGYQVTARYFVFSPQALIIKCWPWHTVQIQQEDKDGRRSSEFSESYIISLTLNKACRKASIQIYVNNVSPFNLVADKQLKLYATLITNTI